MSARDVLTGLIPNLAVVFRLQAVIFCAAVPSVTTATDATSLIVIPQNVLLQGPEASDQIVVLRSTEAGTVDITGQVQFEWPQQSIAEVLPGGRILPRTEGTAELRIRDQQLVADISVTVSGLLDPEPVSFHADVLPVLTRAGCNSGGCHGRAEGQNGFRLSVFGSDPGADHAALVSEGRGRRVFAAVPENSLLLRKATAEIPHGGGQKFSAGSRWYRMLRRWISEGMQLDSAEEDDVVRLRVQPEQMVLTAGMHRQLRVLAELRDGSFRPITAECDFESNQDDVADVDSQGQVTGVDVPGEAAILVRYAGHVTISRVIRPQPESTFQRPAENNFVDRLVWDRLQLLGIPVGQPADDATYLRRVFLDVTGTLPTPAEVREFLADTRSDRREQIVRDLMQRPEYASFWAQRWADLLRVDKDIIAPEGAVGMTRWIRSRIETNQPYDQFVREILTAGGSTFAASPAGFFQVHATPEDLARSTSQLFLGVRIECAQCHHHPFERWGQEDYFAWAGFFTGVKSSAQPGGGSKIRGLAGKPMAHPRTGVEIAPAPLGSAPASLSAEMDWREGVSDWMTSRDNPWFARMIANRMWSWYFGRGLVEPIDDLRSTNPASNEPLLDALAEHLVELNFDLQQFALLLTQSAVYQLDASTVAGNSTDDRNGSHALWRPLQAEVLLDAVSQATGTAAEFNGWPVGYRAIEIWDNKLPSRFLSVFGRPQRQTVCSCERGMEPSIAQALHLMNSETTLQQITSRHGRCAKLAESDQSPSEIIDELYLCTLSRFPSDAERQAMLPTFSEAASRSEAIQDLLWVLLNTREFVFNH